MACDAMLNFAAMLTVCMPLEVPPALLGGHYRHRFDLGRCASRRGFPLFLLEPPGPVAQRTQRTFFGPTDPALGWYTQGGHSGPLGISNGFLGSLDYCRVEGGAVAVASGAY